MKYERQILEILYKVGVQGINVPLLSKHVYNMSCTLFEQPDQDEILRRVRYFVTYYSRSSSPILLVRTPRWGYYRLNAKGQARARQLLTEGQQQQATD